MARAIREYMPPQSTIDLTLCSFVTLLVPPGSRHTTPVVKRSLNPVFPAAQSTFDFPIYLSLAAVIGGRGLEGVVWDKVRRVRCGSLLTGLGSGAKGVYGRAVRTRRSLVPFSTAPTLARAAAREFG